MSAIVYGKLRGIGHRYPDGLESMEVHVPMESSGGLPLVLGKRVTISLVVGGAAYIAGLRATDRNGYAWICPDLQDRNKKKVTLARVMKNMNIRRNQQIRLHVIGTDVHLSAFSE